MKGNFRNMFSNKCIIIEHFSKLKKVSPNYTYVIEYLLLTKLICVLGFENEHSSITIYRINLHRAVAPNHLNQSLHHWLYERLHTKYNLVNAFVT